MRRNILLYVLRCQLAGLDDADMTLILQVFKNPKPALLAILKESGPVPGDANGVKAREESAKKKKRPDKGVSLSKHSHIYQGPRISMLTEHFGYRLTWRNWPRICKR